MFLLVHLALLVVLVQQIVFLVHPSLMLVAVVAEATLLEHLEAQEAVAQVLAGQLEMELLELPI
jgi:hypothetical protein